MTSEAITKMASADEKPKKTQEELRADLEQRANILRTETLKKLDVYEKRLADGDFGDQDGEPAGSGEKRKLDAQKELLNADARLDRIREKLDSGDELGQDSILAPENIKLQNQAFLQETFKIWYDDAKSKVEQVPILVKPKDQDYDMLKDDTNPSKFGEYTLNPDIQDMDFENIHDSIIIIPDLSAFEGKPLSDVAKHLIDTYSKTHYLLGIEYWKWLILNPSKSPAKLKDGNYYFNFGSLVRGSDGHWYVPFANWRRSGWYRDARRLIGSWDSNYRVVLIKI